jgi:DNA repair protein RadD
MIKFRPYQRQCIDAFYQYYDTGRGGHGLIVVPTAGGKSLIIGGLATEICQTYSGQRILILSHVRELILQNHSKVLAAWREAPAGIYSAALGRRQAHADICTATIQSVYKKAAVLGHRDLCFIDEAHLLQAGNMGMYGRLIAELLAINPAMKLCGFTATDYRLDCGLLTEGDGKIFDDTIIEIPISHLLEEGYLTPPISKSSLVQADLEGVKRTAGEFNLKQMAERFDQRAFISAALDADLPFFADRRSIALFCATLENAAHVADGMLERGIDCEVIDGEMSVEDREDKLERFRSGELRALASVGVITTGTDIPNIDCIDLFRATESPGLLQQIVGRGFRVMYKEGYDLDTRQGRLDAIRNGIKPNFLVLDHGGNIERHGAITHIEKPARREKGERAKIPKAKCRICEICRTAWPLEITICGMCGHQMKIERDPTTNLNVEASNANIMGTAFMRGESAQWFDVDDVKYSRHKKEGAPHTLKVTYYCGVLQFNEWKHFERIGSLRQEALKWWGMRTAKVPPDDVAEALKWVETLKKPLRIQVVKKENLYEVIRYGFQPIPQKSTGITATGSAYGGEGYANSE